MTVPEELKCSDLWMGHHHVQRENDERKILNLSNPETVLGRDTYNIHEFD